MSKSKVLAVFIIILAVLWQVTDYRGPLKPSKPKIDRRALPKEKPYDFPAEYVKTHKKMAEIFKNVTSSFTEGNVPVIVLTPFVMAPGASAEGPQDNSSPSLPAYLTESAYSYLYNDKNVRVVRRNYDLKNRSRIQAKYILIGRISSIGNQIRVTVRLENVTTGEILDSHDEYLDKAQVSRFL